MPRPEPVHGRMETRTMRFLGWMRRATDPRGPGGAEIVHEEALDVVALIREDLPDRHLIVTTMRHVGACVGGAEAMDSYRAATTWEERQRERAYAEAMGASAA